jgi:hypothetical protein
MNDQGNLNDSAQVKLSAVQMLTEMRITSLVGNKNSSLSPSSPNAAFTVKSFDIATKKGYTDIYLYYLGNNGVRKLTRSAVGIYVVEPEFCCSRNEYFPESILFLKEQKLWQISINGGEAFQVSNSTLPIETFHYFNSPDGKPYVACVFNVFHDRSIDETSKILAEQAGQSSGVTFDKLMVRHWDNWGTYSKRNHVFLCPLDVSSDGDLSLNTQSSVDIMFGLESDCPGKGPGGGREEFSVSSDGFHLAFSARRTIDGKQRHDFSWSTGISIYIASLASFYNGNPVSITEISDLNSDAYNGQPTFSPDSKALAYLAMTRAQYESDKLVLCIYDIESKRTVRVTEDLDLSFQSIEWSGDHIYSTAQYMASTRVFRIAIDDDLRLKSIDILIGDESKSSPVLADFSKIVYLESSLTKPSEVKLAMTNECFRSFVFVSPKCEDASLSISDDMRLFREIYCPCPHYQNGDNVMPEVSQHYFPGANGEPVHCWFLRPEASDMNGAKIPLILVVHGGPQSAFNNTWSYRWNLALLASQGYAVAAVNFHGSTGFGQEFVDSIRHNWGGKPFEDCTKCVDYILEKYSFVDKTRVAAMGASYGGYMM